MFFLLALSLVSSAFAQQAGGYTPATAEEIAPGSHCHVLASYAFEQLKAQSNSLDLNHKSFGNVLSMENQVVSGTNYRIRAHLQPSGSLSLSVFEQPWTHTLEVTEASFTPSDESNAILTLVGASSHLRLDANEYAKRLELAQPQVAAAAPAQEPAPEPKQSLKSGLYSWIKKKLLRFRA
eukprot:jgi/Chrpa1/11833/Chrysochromulina_OHIO_Genome00013758-RA